MVDMKENKEKIKELYGDITALDSGFPLSEEDFNNKMQDKDFAKKLYGFTSSKGVNLLGAENEQVFLDTLGYQQTKQETAQKRKDVLSGITAPEQPVKDIKSLTSDVEYNTNRPTQNLFKKEEVNPISYHTQQKPIAQQVFGIESVIGMESPKEKTEREIAQLGEDKINDVRVVDSLIAEKQKALDDFDAINGDFIREYENKDLEIKSNDPLYGGWSPSLSMFRKKEDNKFIDENSERFNELQRERKAIQNSIDNMETYRQYAEWDRGVEVGKRLSSMVSNGEIDEGQMDVLRKISDDKERDEYLLNLYNSGQISKETLKNIHDLGDTSDKSGLWYGLTKTGKLKDFVSVGLTQLERNIDIASLTAKFNRGGDLTDEEKQTLAIYNKLNQIKDNDRSFGFEAGMGLQRSMQFVLESMLTGGVGAVGAKTVGKTVIGRAMRKLGANAARQAKLVPFTPSAYNNFFERMANTSFYKSGDVDAWDVAGNVYKSYVNTLTERFAESLGGMFANKRLLNNLIANKVTRKIIGESVDNASNFIDNIAGKETFKKVSNGLTQVGISNIPGEFAEEIVGQTGNVLLTNEGSMKEVFSKDFLGQVALQSLLLGGFNSVASYGLSKATDAVNLYNNKRDYKKSMDELSKTQFDNPEMEALKEQLVSALNENRFLGEDGGVASGDVNNIMSALNNAYMDDLAGKIKNGVDNKANAKAYEVLDKAVRNAAVRYGEDKAIESYVQAHIGDFINKDGNVYELYHNGKEYFVLESTPEGAVVVREKGTDKKETFGKDYFANAPIKTTNGTDWATQEFLLNINNWRQQDETSEPQAESGVQNIPSHIRWNSQQYPVIGYDAEANKYTITDETGANVEIDADGEGIEKIYTEQNPIEDVQSAEDIELEYEQTEEDQPEYVAPKDDYGNIDWSQVPTEKLKETLDATFPKEGRALGYIDQRIAESVKRLSSLKKKGAPTSEVEYNQYMDDIDALQEDVKRWKNIKDEYTNATIQSEQESADLSEDNTIPVESISEEETVSEIKDNTTETNDDIDWYNIPADKFKQTIDSEIGAADAMEYIDLRIKDAKRAVANQKKRKAPKSAAEFKEFKNAARAAQAELDYWTTAKDVYTQPIAVEEAIEEQPVTEIYKNTEDSVLPEGVQPYTFSQEIKDKYNNAPKSYGKEDIYVDADGNTYKGRWLVTEAFAVTPSHNSETLQPSEGFAVTPKGKNVNDNDYTDKLDVIDKMTSNYDARGFDPVIVQEGGVLSGSNRTIAKQRSAVRGTDTKYLEALPMAAKGNGINEAELSKYEHPYMVFEIDEKLPLTTETFAKFNRPRSKTKSPVDMAIAIGKQDTSRLVGKIIDTIGEVEKLSDLYQNQNTVASIMKQIVNSGIINQNEMPQFYTEQYGITDAGKDFVETLLVGSVINEDQIRMLNTEGMKQYREKIVSSMLPIAKNMTYEDNFGKELNTAIKYLKEARDAKTNIEGILLDNPMFDKKDYNRLAIFTALMLQRKPTEFRQFVNNLNERAELGGENLFGEQENAQSVLDDYKQQNKLSDYEQRTINLTEGGRQTDVQGISTSVRGDEANINREGERGDGNVISEEIALPIGEDGLLLNKDGSPMVLYHGTTNKGIKSVTDLAPGHRRDDGDKAIFNGDGISFTPSRSVALDYANGAESNVFSANIKLQSPYVSYGVANMSELESADFTKSLKSEGYDGIIVYPSLAMKEIGATPSEVIIFDSNSIIESVDNGNNEQSELSLLGDSNEESGTRGQDISAEVGGNESKQSVERTSDNRGADRTGNANLSEAVQSGEGERSDLGESPEFSIRTSPAPRKTGIGYKVFVLKDGKLYPPMVANPNGEATPVNIWLDADAAPIAGQSKTGRNQVKAGGKGTQGGSGSLAYRPGWHLGEIPYALQFNRKNPNTGERELFPANFVWAEVEYADDVNYQEEAMNQGVNQNGKFQHSLAGLQRVPEDGSYRYRTNPNPETDPWIITGAMKVNRILTPSEVDAIVTYAGRKPQPRQEGAITDSQVEKLNKDLGLSENISKMAKQLATDAVVSTLKESGIEVIEATDKQAKQVLQSTNGVEAQIVYHGSAAKFDKFDHSYMGTGEGAQAYGWGSYVTEVEGIGKSYAATAVRNGGRGKVFMNGVDVTDSVPYAISISIHKPTDYAAFAVMKYRDGAKDFIQSRIDTLTEQLDTDLLPSMREKMEKAIQFAKEAKDAYDNNKWEYQGRSPQLYTVEIPDDNGSNYLAWDENISEERLSDILNNVYEVVKDDSSFDFETYKNSLETLRGYDGTVTGQDVYEITMNYASEFVAGAQKKASEILSKAGFTGVSVPAQFRTGGRADGAKNYVIFNENDLQIKDRIEFMKTPNGTIYGWTVGGKIYITKDGFNPDTPIHEYTHIWANAMRQNNPKGWESIKNLLRNTPVWNEVMSDDNYKNIRDNEDSVASEVLSRISGKENAAKMEAEAQKMIDDAKGPIAKARVQELINKVKKAVEKFWNWVGTELFKIEKFESVEQVADRVLYDLLNKTDLKAKPSSEIEAQISNKSSDNTMQMSWTDQRIQELQDQMLPVRKVMDEIKKRGGVVNENSDPYSQEFLATSRAASEIEGFMDERYKPLAKATNEAIGVFGNVFGMDAEDANKAVYDYIYARHAPERNKKICTDEVTSYVLNKVSGPARRLLNKPMLEAISQHVSSLYDSKFNGTRTPLTMSGLSYEQKELIRDLDKVAVIELNKIATMKDKDGNHIGNNRSGMSDEEAKDILGRLYIDETKAALDNVSEKIRYCTDFTLDKWLEYGLINKATYDSYKNLYQYYIPLRGWEDKEDIDYSSVPSNAFNKSGELVNLNRKAGGRWSRADNPIAYIGSLAMSASITGNRNLIRQKAFNLITDNLGLISDFAGMIYEDEEPDFLKNKSEEQKKAHKIPVWIDGQRMEFALAGEMGIKAATAINGTHSKTRSIAQQYMSQATRFISSSLTAKNIEFLFKNLIRDMGFGGFAYFVENGGKATGELYSKLPSAFAAALRNAKGESIDSEVDALYKEFKDNGGQTGYIQMETIDKLGKEFERLANNESKNAARVVFDAIDIAGKASENAMRFAVYMTEREKGATPREAAIRAKEITVNFNRQGLHTKGWASVYAFFNPAIQGTFRFAKLAKTNPQRFWTTVASITAAKVALTLLGEFFGGGDDETDESTYSRISDYVKATNLIIPMDWFGGSSKKGNYLAIPLPQSLRAFTRFGDEFVEVVSGRKKWWEGIWDASMFSVGEFMPVDINAIDFTSDNVIGTIGQAFIPTIMRPMLEVAINQNFMGNPIRKEPFVKSQDYIPQHKLAFKSTPSVLVGTSEFLNRVAGGDDKRSAKYQISENGQVTESGWGSFMDVNPANIDHLAKGYFGGYYNLLIDLMDVAVGATSKDIDINMNSVPIAGQFFKEVTSKPGYKSFYAMKEEVENINSQLRNYKGDKDSEEYSKIASNPYNTKLVKDFRRFSKTIEKLNNAMLKADKDKQAEYQDKIDAEYEKAGKYYNELCKQRDKVNK